MANLLCSTTTNATYIHESSSMIPHSYLVHFELVQTYYLSIYAMHISYFDHTRTWHQSLSVMINHTKAHHPPETKRKQVKWVIMLMDPCSKKKKGKDDKSKSMDDGQVSLFTHAHDQSIWMALLLRDTLFELARYMEKMSIYLCYHTKERGFALRESYTMSIKEFALFQKSKNPPSSEKKSSQSWWRVLRINRQK